jgi:hypothetical protein
MSRRRGSVVLVVVPLATLVVSFLVVLVLGGLLGTDQRDVPLYPKLTPSPTAEAVSLKIDGLTARSGELQPFPGLKVTVSPAEASNGTGANGDFRGSTVNVEICVSPENGWTVEGEGWAPKPRNGDQVSCRRGRVSELDSLQIRVRHQ